MITVDKFVEKIEKEMRSGLISILLLSAIEHSGPIHGYGIIKTVHQISNGTFSFKEGTIYPLLAEVEKMGFVRSFWGSGNIGPQRKYYQISGEGREALRQLTESWKALHGTVDDVMENMELAADSVGGKGKRGK